MLCATTAAGGDIFIQGTPRKCISIRNGPLNLLSKREETEEEKVVDKGGGGSEIEESERSSVILTTSQIKMEYQHAEYFA